MVTQQTDRRIVTPERYNALVEPVTPPTPEELFEHERAVLADARLAPIDMFDRIAHRLPSGLFLLEPPQPAPIHKLDWNDLMARVQLRDKKGRTWVSTGDMSDEIKISTRPTMLKDVEDGRQRRNIRPSTSLENITAGGRNPYTAWRGYIHLLLFPSVIEHHGLDIVASRCDSSYFLYFYLNDERPALYNGYDNAYPDWGAPSCGEVEEL